MKLREIFQGSIVASGNLIMHHAMMWTSLVLALTIDDAINEFTGLTWHFFRLHLMMIVAAALI